MPRAQHICLRVSTWSLNIGPERGPLISPLVYPAQPKGPHDRTLKRRASDRKQGPGNNP